MSRFWDRINRPDQLPGSLLEAMRVLTDPAETGAVTLALPQDVQTEAFDYPEELFARRVWHVARPVPEPAMLARAVEVLRGARKPLLVAGGGVIYAEATGALAALVEATGIPVAETYAGKGSMPYDHPSALGAIGVTGTDGANAMAREADVVVGVGTRWADFATASHSIFADPGVRFVNVNVAPVDAFKHAATPVVADAREALEALAGALAGWAADDDWRQAAAGHNRDWDAKVERVYRAGHGPLPSQGEVIGAVNDAAEPRDVVVCAAGSMPADLHKLWRTRDPKQFHLEYGNSCMGYEIPGAIGIRHGRPQPRGVRHGRRRRLPDEPGRAGHGRGRGDQDHRGPGPEPRLRLDRVAVGGVGQRPLRHQVPLRGPTAATAGCSRWTWPPTRPASGPGSWPRARSGSWPAPSRRPARPTGRWWSTSRPTRSST